MSYPVLISYTSTNEERSLAQNLANYLGANGIKAEGNDPNRAELSMKQGLSTARWLVLILTPQAVGSPHLQSLVETAFTYVSQGSMQGILALAFLSNPIDLEYLPSSLWSTIRIYYTSDSDTDLQKAFEKLSRTMSATKVPVRAVSSPPTNWASPFSSVASRTLPSLPQPARGPRSSLTPRRVIVIALFFILVFFGGFFLAMINPFAKKSPVAITTPKIHVPPSVIPTKPASTPSPTPGPQQLYNKITASTQTFLNNPMSAQSDNQWTTNNTSCTFINGEYQVSSSSNGQYEPCMETTNFQYFAYQIQMQFSTEADEEGGLIFRADKAVSIFYRFSLDSSTGDFSLTVCHSCSFPYKNSDGKPLEPGSNAVLAVPNTLTVIALQQYIYIFVNGKLLINVKDPTISQGGEIGVFAASVTQQAKVIFSNLKVWNLTETGDVRPSPTPTQIPGEN